jgi:hypothetical protein
VRVRAQHVGGAVIVFLCLVAALAAVPMVVTWINWLCEPQPTTAKILPFTGSLLEQGQQQAGELAAKVTTDGHRVDGELSVTAQGQSWAAKVWARVTGQRQAKPDVSAGVEISKSWD